MSNSGQSHCPGQRLSLKGQACTVRYVGSVADKPGSWLGVEWDDQSRGKHNGTHEGKEYFTCRSSSLTCASFLRPTQSWDSPTTFLQALREKYMPEFHASEAQIVYISGKQAEEVGFEKFHRRQAKLQGIHVIVLDHMRIQHRLPRPDEDEEVSEICADITELDLSGNLFESFDEIHDLCRRLRKLKILTLDGNRFEINGRTPTNVLRGVGMLNLRQTLMLEADVGSLLKHAFPSLQDLSLANNEYSGPFNLSVPPDVSTIDLSDNRFEYLSDLHHLSDKSKSLHTLILKRNSITSISSNRATPARLSVRELDLSYNKIANFDFFHSVNLDTFPSLRHLRITGNPLYQSLVSAEGKPMTSEEGYMLTIARLPQLEYLNYSKITDKERLNAETYYLGQIAVEIRNAPRIKENEVITHHPLYRALCEEYGEPNIKRKGDANVVDPNTLAARLVSVTFDLAPTVLAAASHRSWVEEIPKTFSIYSVLGVVGKRLGFRPLSLRLILETNERDPIGLSDGYSGPEWWDTSDDEVSDGRDEFVKREVALVAGTRALATYVEGQEARVRVELIRENG